MSSVVATPPAQPSPRRIPRHVVGLLILAALWGICRFAFGEVNDDAMITFVYARNLARGVGFVFNPGEWIYGTTTPIFGVFVSLGILAGFEPWTWVYLWDVVWGFFILWRLRQMFEAAGFTDWFWLAGGLLVLASGLTLPVGGMETAFYEVFLFSTLASLMRREPAERAVFWGTLAAVTRPDGVVILGVVGLYALLPLLHRREWRAFARACWPLGLLALHFILVWAAFGTIVPQSMQAKAESMNHLAFESSFLYGLMTDTFFVFGRIHLVGIVGLIGFLLTFRLPEMRPVNLFAILYIALFSFGRAPGFMWYRTPLLILLFCYAVMAVASFVRALPGWADRIRLPHRQAITSLHYYLIGACLLELLLLPHIPIHFLLLGRAFRDPAIDVNQKRLADAARYIRSHSDEYPNVASHEIGYLGYFVEGYIDDFEGLVSPQAVEARGNGIDPFLLTDADWFVQATNYADPAFYSERLMERTALHGFEIVETFPWKYGMTYVFHRTTD
ncbi:MAG: hypothetical protein PWP23_1973 [Candidatus Sumerlaeota bacterium]|nr:hypothetical protein [Candidatus Sumerlaeota bacterium]